MSKIKKKNYIKLWENESKDMSSNQKKEFYNKKADDMHNNFIKSMGKLSKMIDGFGENKGNSKA